MSEQPTSDPVCFRKRQALWYRSESGLFEANFVRNSESGKRVYIRYRVPSTLDPSRFVELRAYVNPKNVEPRHVE